jgi:hypothetical protein
VTTVLLALARLLKRWVVFGVPARDRPPDRSRLAAAQAEEYRSGVTPANTPIERYAWGEESASEGSNPVPGGVGFRHSLIQQHLANADRHVGVAAENVGP